MKFFALFLVQLGSSKLNGSEFKSLFVELRVLIDEMCVCWEFKVLS